MQFALNQALASSNCDLARQPDVLPRHTLIFPVRAQPLNVVAVEPTNLRDRLRSYTVSASDNSGSELLVSR